MLTENLKTTLERKLWLTAERLIKFYDTKSYKIKQLDKVCDSHPYKMHLVCTKGYEVIGIDIRERCNVESYFEKHATSCLASRVGVKLFFALPEYIEGIESMTSSVQRDKLKMLGIGLLIVKENNKIEIDIGTISCDRRFVLPAGSALGIYKNDVSEIIEKYNTGMCLDAIRDLCEKTEDATVRLALKAARLNKIAATTDEINRHDFDWSNIITGLSMRVWRGRNQTQVITDIHFRDSLNEFRSKRNLSDHRKTQKELKQLEEQYPEAMLQGIRLLRGLVRLNNNLK